jgi:type IV pilus assembly protein PilA
MLKRIREMKDEDGFTLIELMVVVLIIAILIAIAIPTFLGLRERAQNRSAQSDLRNALTAAKAFYTDNDTYTGFTATEGDDIEPALSWNEAGTATEGAVSVRGVGADTVLLVTLSASGERYCMGDDDGTIVQGNPAAEPTAVGDCNGGF